MILYLSTIFRAQSRLHPGEERIRSVEDIVERSYDEGTGNRKARTEAGDGTGQNYDGRPGALHALRTSEAKGRGDEMGSAVTPIEAIRKVHFDVLQL